MNMATASTRTTKIFPLPLDFWRPPRLSLKAKKEYMALAKAMVENTTRAWSGSCHAFSRSSFATNNQLFEEEEPQELHSQFCDVSYWQFLHEKQGVSLFKGLKEKAMGNSFPEIRGVGHIHATLDEVMDMIICDSTVEMRRMGKKIYSNFLDGAVIHTLVPRTEANPNRYMGIKWLALKSPLGFSSRDYCFLEYVDICKNNMGQTAGFRFVQSIDIPDIVPSLYSTHHLVRGCIVREAHVFSSSRKRGVLRITHTLKEDVRGKIPSSIAQLIIEKRVLNIFEMENFIDNERIAQMKFIDTIDQLPKGSSSSCPICMKSFGTWKKSHSCVACGDLVCHGCSTKREMELSFLGSRKVRICNRCVLQSRAPALEKEEILIIEAENNQYDQNYTAEVQSLALADQLSLESQRLMSRGSIRILLTYRGPYSSVCTKVIATGSWCEWRSDPDFGAILMHKQADGSWNGYIYLSPGVYQYKFFVDNHIWTHANYGASKTTMLSDSCGGLNLLLHVAQNNQLD